MKRILLLAALALAACTHEHDTTSLYDDVRSVDKMVFASMSVSKLGVLDSESFWKIGDRIAAYSYRTYLEAYIDLSALRRDDVKIDESAKTVTITLPPVQTALAGRDMEMTEEHYRVTGLRSQIRPEERAEVKERINAKVLSEIESDPQFRAMLTESAKTKARTYFETLLKARGYTATVDFR